MSTRDFFLVQLEALQPRPGFSVTRIIGHYHHRQNGVCEQNRQINRAEPRGILNRVGP